MDELNFNFQGYKLNDCIKFLGFELVKEDNNQPHIHSIKIN